MCLRIHPKAQFICRMCNISHENLDEPEEPYELQDMHLLKGLLHNENYASIKKMGYYPCKQNILLELQYSNGKGLNQAVPPEGLHVTLIGYFMYLIQGLSRCRKVTGATIAARALEVKGTDYVFSGEDRVVVNSELKAIGFQLIC